MAKIDSVIKHLKSSIDMAEQPASLQPFSDDDGSPGSLIGSYVNYRGVDYVVVQDQGDFALVAEVGAMLPAPVYFIPVTRRAV